MTLTELYQALFKQGALVVQQYAPLPCEADAVLIAVADIYGVFLDLRRIITTAQEKAAVSHELAHIVTGATYTINAAPSVRQRAEKHAIRAQIEMCLPYKAILQAIKNGYTEPHSLAEYFDLPEEFVRQAYEYYTEAKNLSFEEACP